jgi:hypothetical protein
LEEKLNKAWKKYIDETDGNKKAKAREAIAKLN